MEIRSVTNEQLILELSRRGLLTNSSNHDKIVEELLAGSSNGIKCVLTYGIPKGTNKCSRCRQEFPCEEFSYYQSRVSKDGHLMRSNAVCTSCGKETTDELKEAKRLHEEKHGKILKPKAGDECLHCKRTWDGNWHLHHQGDKIIGYICGHCNMSFSDHRNREVFERENREIRGASINGK